MTVDFTVEELENLTVVQLKRLCVYYDIEVFRGWNKAKLVEVIFEYLKPIGMVGSPLEDRPMSERVRRIRESRKGETL